MEFELILFTAWFLTPSSMSDDSGMHRCLFLHPPVHTERKTMNLGLSCQYDLLAEFLDTEPKYNGMDLLTYIINLLNE